MLRLSDNVARLTRLFRCPEKFQPDAERDIFLVTYPRSGTTWVSCIAAELLYRRSPENLTEVVSLVPDLRAMPSAWARWRQNGTYKYVPDVHVMPDKSVVPAASHYLIKSHFQLNGAPLFGEYRRVIYLIRDPRDILLSYYRFVRFVARYPGDLKEFAMDWMAGRIWPCSWQEHVNSWLALRPQIAPFELTLLRYEDFVTDPVGQTEILAKSLRVEVEKARIEEITADTSPRAMRERELKGNNGFSPDFNFIGPAKPGNWKELRSRDERDAVAIVEEFAHDTMRRVGYPILEPALN